MYGSLVEITGAQAVAYSEDDMKRLGFVGTGAITSAIVKGLANSNLKDWPIIVSPRSRERAEELAAAISSVAIATDNQAVVDGSDMVFLAIRPQIAPEVIRSLSFHDGQFIVCLVAGMKVGTVAHMINAKVSVTRAIPLPSVEQCACATPILPVHEAVKEVFDALGSTLPVENETVFDSYVAGSAVMATYFGIVKSAADWMQANGLDAAEADHYVRNLFGNLGAILRQRPHLTLDELRRDHTTPGGLNELVHELFVSSGGSKALGIGLDAVLERIAVKLRRQD
jgi:pyrroline-5-carboxylate reductase